MNGGYSYVLGNHQGLNGQSIIIGGSYHKTGKGDIKNII